MTYSNFNSKAVTIRPSREECAEAYESVGYSYGIDDYIGFKMALGDSMVDTTGENTRFWLGSPRKEIKDSALSLYFLKSAYEGRVKYYRVKGSGYELYGKKGFKEINWG